MTRPIEKMTLKQLQAHRAKIDDAIEAAKQKELAAVKAKVKAIAEDAGLTVAEVMEVPPRTYKPRKKSKVKHVNPKNKSQTWSGMGRPPSWYKQLNGDAR